MKRISFLSNRDPHSCCMNNILQWNIWIWIEDTLAVMISEGPLMYSRPVAPERVILFLSSQKKNDCMSNCTLHAALLLLFKVRTIISFSPCIMQYCPAGSVTDLAKAMRERGERIAEDVIAYILREVLAGLSYLHSSCVMHRDVKGQNVLLTKTARVKLIDFGMASGQ